MKKNLIFLVVTLSLFISGCTSYSITKYFDKDEFYNKAIQYTKKSDIVKNNNIVAMLNVTYLNSVSKDFQNGDQNFIIGIYIVDDEKKQGLRHPEYTLLLNDKEPITIQELKDNDKIKNNVPLKNHWAKYYFVSFEKEKEEFFEEENHDLTVSYENIEDKRAYLIQKEIEEKELESQSLLDEEEQSTLIQAGKASVSFLKEL